MNIILPIIVSLVAAAAAILIFSRIDRERPEPRRIMIYAVPVIAVALYTMITSVLDFRHDTFSLTAAALIFTAGACMWIGLRGSDDDRRTMLSRMGKAAVLIIILELSIFNYSAYTAPRKNAIQLDLNAAATSYMTPSADGGYLMDANNESSITWDISATDASNISLRFDGSAPHAVQIKISANDRNFSTRKMQLYSDTLIAHSGRDIVLPLSSQGMTSVTVTLSGSGDLRLTGAALNSPIALSANLLRVILLLLIICAAIGIYTMGLHRVQYCPGMLRQRIMTIAAAALCIIMVSCIAFAHANDTANNGSLLLDYNGDASGHDPYYQQFDAFQKGQLNLDISVDQKLLTAGELAYDSGYRSDMGISAAWDRAYYNGKYYSYFGTSPLFLFYYPVYLITGKVPTTALTCMFFSALFIIFGFMLIFKIARAVIKKTNYMLTLLAAVALTMMSGIYILTAYGDFYNLPKLCGLAFMMLLGYLTIEGYERPRWYIFLLCGLCAGIMLASRPNVLIVALGLAPVYIGVLLNKELSIKRKLTYVGSFLLPVAAIFALLAAYNMARFGSFTEFGAKYQLTVNNIAMNNTSLGFLGTAFHNYFLQLPELSPVFPFISPRYQPLSNYTRYFYITMAFGVLTLPVNWSLAAYPAVRKRCGVRPVYRYTLITTLIMTVVVALLDFSLAGLTISYVCDIAAAVAVVSIAIMLTAERTSRDDPAVHKGVFIAAVILLCLTFFVCLMLLLGTEPHFIRNSMPGVYGDIQDLFRF